MAPKEFIGALVVETAETRWLEVVELNDFAKDARKIFNEEELGELHQHFGMFRQLGTIIKGTGGLRKARWSASGKGKRGGARVIYYYGGDHMPIYLIAVYSKSEKADMTQPEKKAATKFVAETQRNFRSKRADAPPRLRVVKSKGRR
jgi:hypothetical protein